MSQLIYNIEMSLTHSWLIRSNIVIVSFYALCCVTPIEGHADWLFPVRVLDPPLLPFTGWILELLPYTANT